MAERRTGTGSDSDESATPLGDDLPGEELANPVLADPEPFEIAADETEAEELDDASEATNADGDEIDDIAQLEDAEEDAREADSSEPKSLADRVAGNRPARRGAQVAKKDAPTARRKGVPTKADKRTTPVQFAGESVEELKKVVWPTAIQVRQYFIVVLVFVLFVIAYVVGLDTGFGTLLLKLLGGPQE